VTTWAELGLTCRAMVWSNDPVVGQGIFMGCDNKLYLYKVEEDIYYYIGAVESTYNIKRLWVNSLDSNKIYIAAWKDYFQKYKYGKEIKIYTYDGTSVVYVSSDCNDLFVTNESVFDGLFSGEFGNRTGIYNEGVYSIGKADIGADHYLGENLLLPFTQIASSETISVAFPLSISSSGETPSSVTYTTANELEPHYYSFYKGAVIVTNPIDKAFSFGQRGCIELLDGSGSSGSPFTNGGILYTGITRNAPTTNYTFALFNCADGLAYNVADCLVNYELSGYSFQPTCMTFDGVSSVYVAGMCWIDATGYTSGYIPSKSYIIKISNVYTSATTSVSVIYDSSGDSNSVYKTFLDMRYCPFDKLILTYIDRDKFGMASFGGVCTHSTTASNTLSNIRTLYSIPRGLTISSDFKDAFLTSNGLLYKYNTINGNLEIQGDGTAFVETDTNLSSNLCVISAQDINDTDTNRLRTEDMIFGVSAPYFPNETQANIVLGKYYLWKFDNYLSDRVELADFTNMSIWEAITSLVEIAPNYVCGFNVDDEGSFFLQDKGNASSTTALTVSSDVLDNNLITMTKNRGLDEIFNYSEASPSYAKLADINIEYYMCPRSTKEEEDKAIKSGDIIAASKASHNIAVKLLCTRQGFINRSFSDVGTVVSTGNCALFKWQLFERDIEACIVGDVISGSTTIVVASTFRGGVSPTELDSSGNTIIKIINEAINIGDYITVVNPDNQKEETSRISGISNDILTIETAFTFSIKSQTIVTITHPFDLGGSSKTWSSEGVTTLSIGASAASTVYVISTRDLAVGTIIQVGTSNFARISSIGRYSPSSSGFSVGVVGSTITATKGDTVYAYFSPSQTVAGDYDYYEIGETKLFVKINPSENSSCVQVKEGDRITISSEGMILEQNDQSKQNAYNMTSIDKYGRIEHSVNNKFLRRDIAKHYVRHIVQEFGDPHYIITLDCLLQPTLTFVDDNGIVRIQIYSKKLFPGYNKIIAYPRSITHNLKQGTTTIECRDVEPY